MVRNGYIKLPYLVCELANSHGGDEAILEKLVDQFGKLDYPRKGIKFQVFDADKIALPDFEWYPVYKQLQFSGAVWASLIDRAELVGDVWIDVFDIFSVQIVYENLNKITGFKLQASVLENLEVIDKLTGIDLTKKILAINVSGFGLDEISRFLSVFRKLSENIVLQIGFQSYPTAVADTALQKIQVLKAAFPGVAIGIADHADATTEFALQAPVYANLMGCSFIEKHFCMGRKDAVYDGYSALEPPEMQKLCDILVQASHAATGYFVSGPEKVYLEKSVQIPILRADLAEGSLIGASDLLFRRTAQSGLTWPQIQDIQRSRMVIKSRLAGTTTVRREHFKAARIAAIVACRMKSSRLPRKAILPIKGIASVERCLNQCLATKGLDRVILATSTLNEDAVLQNYLCDGKALLWQGDPEDVIARYLGACDEHEIDVVVRVTADCPLVFSEILELLLQKHFENGADYTAAEACAVGTSGEIINVSALRKILNHFGRAEYSEYMTWYFRNNADVFKVNIVELPAELTAPHRLTLDHPEDLAAFEAIFSELEPGQEAYSADEVLKLLQNRPDIANLNSHIELKYVADKSLIELLNKKTRMRV